MKILMAVHHFPPHYSGGAEWRTLRTAMALQQRGHTVRVVAIESIQSDPVQGFTWYDEIYEGVHIRRLSFNMRSAPDYFRWQYDNPWVGSHIEAMLRVEQPDVFHMVGGYLITASALAAAERVNIPRVISLTDYWWICPRISLLRTDGSISDLPVRAENCVRCLAEERRRFRLPGKIAPGVMDFFWRQQRQDIDQINERMSFLMDTLNRVNAIICPSQFLMATYARMGIHPRLMRFMRQGRDFPGLTPEQTQKTPSSVLRIGYIGQIAKLKGVHVLIEAVRKLPHAKLQLDIYGDLSAFPRYSEMLKQMLAGDPRIRLMGMYDRLSAALQELDVVVVPSLWYENSPNSILEAFAHCTPVITSNLGGMAELVQDGQNGMLFAPGDSDDLARHIQCLLDDPARLEVLRSGIQPIKCIAQEMDELEMLYNQVTNTYPLAKPEGSKVVVEQTGMSGEKPG